MKAERHALMRAGVVAMAVAGLAASPGRAAASSDLASKAKPSVIVDQAVIARHRALGRLPEPRASAVTSGASSVTIVEPSAFDWGDAGVGAAGAVGLMLLACGVVIVSRHGHRVRRDPDAEASAGT